MFHLSALTVALGTVADTDVPAVPDQILAIQNNHFILTETMRLVLAWVGSATLTRAKLASPSMRQIASPYIRPVQAAVQPASNPPVWELLDNGFSIPPFEEIQMLATSGVAMGTERFTGLLWLAKNIDPAPVGNVIPLRFTSTTAGVTNVWTDLTLTWADTIPSGVYMMVLSEHFSTNAIAHRWLFSNQVWRPGHTSFAAESSRLNDLVQRWRLGSMGMFRSNDLPRFQALINGTDASHVGYAHCVRVGNL